MEHTADCRQQMATATADQNRWTSMFPNYCRACGGTGVQVVYERHGFAHGPSEAIEDLCQCLANGKCPCCGWAGIDTDEPQVCPLCLWAIDGSTEALPPDQDCICPEDCVNIGEK